MRPWEGDQALVRGSQQIEQCELAIAREQLVIPLDVEEHGHFDGRRFLSEARRHIDPRRGVSGLAQAVFAEHGATQAVPGRGDVWQSEARPHGEAQVGDAVGIDLGELAEGSERSFPISHHGIGDFVHPDGGHALLVLAPVERFWRTLPMKWTIDRRRRHLYHPSKSPRQHQLPVSALVAASAVAEQHEGERPFMLGGSPEDPGNDTSLAFEVESALCDATFAQRFANPS